MGNSGSYSHHQKEIIDTILHPENEAAVRKIFDSFDKNKSGSLDKAEWTEFGKFLWQADVEQPLDQGRAEAIEQRKALFSNAMAQTNIPTVFTSLGNNTNYRDQRRFAELKNVVKPQDVNEWVARMFALADKDKGGSITFDEFKTFLQNESKKEAEKQKDNYAVAAHSPAAMQKANDKAAFSPMAAAKRDFATGLLFKADSPIGRQLAAQNRPYKAGEIDPVMMDVIQADPGMKAQYEKQPEAVTNFVNHLWDQNATQKNAAEHPEIAQAWANLVQRNVAMQQQLYTGQPGQMPPL